MKKSALTKQMIIEKAAEAFNLHGFGNTSMSKLMEVTGLEKGGLYGHFGSKEELALEAFEFALNKSMTARFESLDNEAKNSKKIEKFFKSFVSFDQDLPGGCPTFNTAVDSMNNSPALKKKAKEAYGKWLEHLTHLIDGSIKEGSYKKVKSSQVAAFLFHALEGSIIAANLNRDKKIVEEMCQELIHYIEWKCLR